MSGIPEPTGAPAGNGVLQTTLPADVHEIDVAGERVQARVYNGAFVGPTLRLRPCARLEFDLVNRRTTPTNLHFHGLHDSPEGKSDNIFRTVRPGETARYVLEIRSGHPTGRYCYRPHQHHFALQQVFGGMSGAIVIDGLQELCRPTCKRWTSACSR